MTPSIDTTDASAPGRPLEFPPKPRHRSTLNPGGEWFDALRHRRRTIFRTTSDPTAAAQDRAATAKERMPDPEIPSDPTVFARETLNFPIDATQAKILTEPRNRIIVNCTRQWGKSTIAAIKALHTALTQPKSLTVIASRSLVQSANILEMAANFASDLNLKTRRARGHRMSLVFSNASRIVAVPGNPDNRRGLSACSLLIVDEAAYCPDKLLTVLSPTLATTNGALWLLSTPAAKKGFFWQAWDHPTRYAKFSVPAPQCSRISRDFLEEERSRLGPAEFESEYLCQFHSSSKAIFDMTAFDNSGPIAKLPPWSESPSDYYIGFDLGQLKSHSALVVVRRQREQIHGRWDGQGRPLFHDLLILEKAEIIPLNQTFASAIERLKRLCGSIRRDQRETVSLAFDATGAGSYFYEQLNAASLNAHLCPIVITDGSQVTQSNGRSRVPRNDLMHALAELLGSRKVRVLNAPGMEELRLQLESFHLEVTEKGKPRYSSDEKDDLVFALALAAWRARNAIRDSIGPQQGPLW